MKGQKSGVLYLLSSGWRRVVASMYFLEGACMTVTVEELYQQAQQLSAEERRRLALLLVEVPQTAIAQPSLGEQLRAIRARIIASGEPLLDEEALSAEVAERRGER